MNLLSPIKTIMTSQLITVSEYDPMHVIEDIFKASKIHHVPVVSKGKLVGMLSKSDYNLFIRGFQDDSEDDNVNKYRLIAYKAKDIMTTKLATLQEGDNINIALEVFNENMFHALPVLSGDNLVGIVTTFDIIKALSQDGFAVSEYQ